MKNFNEFVEEVKENIKDYLPKEYAEADVNVSQTRKINENYTAITVHKPGQVVTPSINLNAAYNAYENLQVNLNESMKQIAELVQTEPENMDINVLTEYEKAKNNLFIRVSSLEENQFLVGQVPHMIKEDLLITYHIAAEMRLGGMASTMVNYGMMQNFGIDEEQLHKDALESSANLLPASIRSMSDMVRPMLIENMREMGMTEEEAEVSVDEMLRENAGNPLTVVTNDRLVNGAGVLFYPNMMEELSERLGGDFFILPSSVHEVIVLPDNGEMNYQELKEMVTDVNDTQVESEDKLTDQVYHFDSKNHVFEKASSFADRMKAKEKVSEKESDKKLDGNREREMMKPKRRSAEMSM